MLLFLNFTPLKRFFLREEGGWIVIYIPKTPMKILLDEFFLKITFTLTYYLSIITSICSFTDLGSEDMVLFFQRISTHIYSVFGPIFCAGNNFKLNHLLFFEILLL